MVNKKLDFVNESMENLNLDQLSMNNVNHSDEIMLDCGHRAKSQTYQCESGLNGHVSFADASLLNANLNVCSLSPGQDADGKSIQAGQLFSSYQLADHQDFGLNQTLDQSHLLRDLYLNQIMLPQQDLSKFQVLTVFKSKFSIVTLKLLTIFSHPGHSNWCQSLASKRKARLVKRPACHAKPLCSSEWNLFRQTARLLRSNRS